MLRINPRSANKLCTNSFWNTELSERRHRSPKIKLLNAQMNNLRNYTNLSIRTSNPKFNISPYYCEKILISQQFFTLSIQASDLKIKNYLPARSCRNATVKWDQDCHQCKGWAEHQPTTELISKSGCEKLSVGICTQWCLKSPPSP